MQLLGEIERIADHVVGFLLVGRLQAGNLGKAGVVARILFILGGVHRGVVGNQVDQTAVGAGHRRVGEGVGGHVQTYVLHAHQGPSASVGYPDGFFHRGLFVGAPSAVDAFFLGQLGVLDVLGDFRAGSPWVGVDPGDAGVQSALGNGFIAQKK